MDGGRAVETFIQPLPGLLVPGRRRNVHLSLGGFAFRHGEYTHYIVKRSPDNACRFAASTIMISRGSRGMARP
jgi:hypothetical protein